jgi:hypothetical protein
MENWLKRFERILFWSNAAILVDFYRYFFYLVLSGLVSYNRSGTVRTAATMQLLA